MRCSNMDNRRVMKGNTLYLPVQVAGAYLSMGDAHLAQVGCCCQVTALCREGCRPGSDASRCGQVQGLP